jgi:hypothetical protein
MPKYTVLTPVEHDGERFEKDAILNVSAEVAAPLLAVYAITDGKAKPAEVVAASEDEVA